MISSCAQMQPGTSFTTGITSYPKISDDLAVSIIIGGSHLQVVWDPKVRSLVSAPDFGNLLRLLCRHQITKTTQIWIQSFSMPKRKAAYLKFWQQILKCYTIETEISHSYHNHVPSHTSFAAAQRKNINCEHALVRSYELQQWCIREYHSRMEGKDRWWSCSNPSQLSDCSIKLSHISNDGLDIGPEPRQERCTSTELTRSTRAEGKWRQ